MPKPTTSRPFPQSDTTSAAVSVESGAEYIGISRSSAWRLIKDGTLPCVRLNGRTLLRRVDLDSLLERHVRTA